MIIVTGASGFIGKYVTGALLEKKNEPILCCYHRHDIRRLFPGTKTIQADLSNALDLRKFPAKSVSAVVHLASFIPQSVSRDRIENSNACMEANLVATMNVLEYCRRSKIKKMIYASTVSVYGKTDRPPKEDASIYPETFYGWSKFAAEMLCEKYRRDYGIECFSLRFASVYGPGQNPNWVISKFIQSALQGGPITVWGKGDNAIDFVYVKDVVQAIFRALHSEKPGIYNIGSGKATSIKELAEAVVKVFSRCKTPIVFDKEKPEDATPVWLDIAKAKNKLGYWPGYPLHKGLMDYKRRLTSRCGQC